MAEQEEFRIVLVLPWSRMVLVEHPAMTGRLPRINIPKWTRIAEQVSDTVAAKWNIRSVVIDLLPKEDLLPSCAVIEVRTRNWSYALDGLVAVQIDDLVEPELTATERAILRNILTGDTQERGPFSRLGWIEEAQEWIRESVADHQVEFDEDIRVANVSGFFVLARFGTARGPAYWLKATGMPNLHEFAVMQALALCCPAFLPPLVAVRPAWNAWVTEEAGRPLHASLSPCSFEQCTYSLAGLQTRSAAHIETLLACGCFDQRMPRLKAQLPELIHYLEDAMTKQTSTKVSPLNPTRLHELGNLLEAACAAMEATGIPDTVIHNDMNPGNILLDDTHAVFTDWSEAGIGCPFLTFHHLWVQALEADQTHTWAPQLRDIYKDCWRGITGESAIERAFALAPPLAIASYLCGRDPSFAFPHRSDGHVQSYVRSLARHMDRAARAPEFLQALRT